MNTTLTIKTDKKLRDEVKKTAKQMGIPITLAMNAMMRQFVRDGVLTLEAECPFPSHTPNAQTRKAILEMDHSKGKSAATADEMFEQILGKNWRKKVFAGA